MCTGCARDVHLTRVAPLPSKQASTKVARATRLARYILTYELTYELTHLLTYSLTYLLTYLLTTHSPRGASCACCPRTGCAPSASGSCSFPRTISHPACTRAALVTARRGSAPLRRFARPTIWPTTCRPSRARC
eukprot:scaffold71939_cov33-Phaeocystis_antarctica.AAC.1